MSIKLWVSRTVNNRIKLEIYEDIVVYIFSGWLRNSWACQ